MGYCSARCFVLTICVLQLVSTAERQVFDFLGYMWVPIIGNFFQIIFCILGFFGVYQYRPKYIVAYVIWMVFWIGWNSFVICFYLQVGALDRDSSILNMATGSRSWWETHGVGCHAQYNATYLGDETQETWRKPASVDGCLVEYYYVECAHATLQILLAICGIAVGSYVIRVFTQEDDSSPSGRRNGTLVPYSIEYQRHPSTENPYQRPMTPRKVKRRSTRSRRGSYRQSYYQNPVTKLMERAAMDSSTSNDSYCRYPLPPYQPGQGQVNPAFQNQPPSRPVSIHNGRPSPIYMNDTETII